MKSACSAIIFFLLCACSPSEHQHQAAVMNQIEKAVVLPSGAKPIENYARYYAAGSANKVMVVYVIPPDEPQPYELRKGQRTWLTDYRLLPSINDGGCSVIEFSFDLQSSRVEHLLCNGEA
jgi:hypothetical protein